MKKTKLAEVLKRLTPRSFDLNGRSIYAYDKAVVFNESDIGVNGAKFQVVSFPPGASVSAHFHKKVREVFLIAKGVGTITINGKPYTAKEGDIFLIQPGDRHAFKNNRKKPFVLHIFKWNEDPKDISW